MQIKMNVTEIVIKALGRIGEVKGIQLKGSMVGMGSDI